jgi:hypothetical protein
MYRTAEAFPGWSTLRIGTVDDFGLAETTLRPERELFVNGRAGWVHPVEGAEQLEGMPAQKAEGP